MSATILLVRQSPHDVVARSVVASATGFHWRTFGGGAELGEALQRERFDLIVADHRGQDGDPLDFVATLRRHQAEAEFFLVCDQLELKAVIRAIRAGVRDLFHPPLDFQGLVERLHAAVPRRGEGGPQLEQWSEVAMFLSEAKPAPVPPPVTPGGHTVHAFANEVTAHLAKVTRERDALAAELRAAQERAAEAALERAKLESEGARLAEQVKRLNEVSVQFAELKAGLFAQRQQAGEAGAMALKPLFAA